MDAEEIRRLRAELHEAEAAAEEARGRYHEALVEARREGVPVAELATLLDLTPQRLYQLTRGGRS